MSNLQYKPSLEYEKNYKTSGNLATGNDGSSAGNQGNDVTSKYDELIDKLSSIERVIKGLPDEIYNAVKIPVAGVRFMLNDIGPVNSDSVTTKIVTQNVIDAPIIAPAPGSDRTSFILTEDDLEDIPDEVFPEGDGINIDVSIATVPKSDIIEQEYKFDMLCIFVDYVNNLQKTVGKFFTNVIAASEAIQFPYVSLFAEYSHSSEKVSDNMKPMSDYVIRNQVKLKQQVRMYKKLFDVDSMIVNIRACKSSAELKKRYYTADYGSSSTFLGINQNDILTETRAEFDKKYVENLYNLYKYLNSSVILIDECLNASTKICQAKAALIKNEGVALQW